MSKVIYNFKTSVSMFIEVKNRVSDFSVGLIFCIFANGSRAILPRWNFLGQYIVYKAKRTEQYVFKNKIKNAENIRRWSISLVCMWEVVLPGKGIIRGRRFENDAPPTKTYDVLKMLTGRNCTMFFNIENDYYR